MNTSIEYYEKDGREPDGQYLKLLANILDKGKSKVPIHARTKVNQGSGHSFSLEITNASLSFDLRNGFPIIGHRDITKLVKGGIGEIAGFLNGARTLEELKSFGCPRQFWERWVDKEQCDIFGLKEGDLGPGSYGPILRAFPTPTGPFDQVAALNEAIQKVPFVRTLMIQTWCPHLALGSNQQGFPREVVVAPCHGTDFLVNIFEDQMEVTTFQRSADAPVGLVFNMVQWCTLGLVLAIIHGYKYTRYTHHIGSAHIYDVQIPSVKELLSRPTPVFPKVFLEPEKPYQNPWDLRKEHFKIEEYEPHSEMKIPTPV